MASSYVLAGCDGLSSIIERFMLESDEFDNNFTRDDISNFFDITCNKFLHSFGQDFKGKKKYNKYNWKEAEVFNVCKRTGFFKNSEFIVDSGAFQISMGLLNKRESELLFNMYYEFIQTYPEVFDRAFILDLPPGPGCEMFSSFKDVYNLNLLSFKIAANLPEEIRKKIIYIHHFRTPQIWRICNDILDTDDMFDKFQHFATGGIAANMSGDMSIPCIIYVLPLIPLLNRAIKYKRNKLSFHILGGSHYRDILFYELFKKLVMDKHKIDLSITYDSSTIYKSLMIGRIIPIFDGDSIKKTDLRSNVLHTRFNNHGVKIEEAVIKTMENFSERYGFKKFDYPTIYNPKTNSFYDTLRVYAMLYHLAMYYEIEIAMKDFANKIYPLYIDGDLETFNKMIEFQTRKMNSNKITKKQMIKSYSVSKSLDMLANLDEDYCKYITDKFLVRDEFIELSEEKPLLF